jgi:hypothetical protein
MEVTLAGYVAPQLSEEEARMRASAHRLIETHRIEVGDRVCDFMIEDEIEVALLVPAVPSHGRRMTRAEWRRLIVRSFQTDDEVERETETPIAA